MTMPATAQDFDVRVRRKIHEYAVGGGNRKPTRLYVGHSEERELHAIMGRGFASSERENGRAQFKNLSLFVVNAESHMEVG